MIFGLFESKGAKFWREETNRTLNDARQRFDASVWLYLNHPLKDWHQNNYHQS